MNYYNSLLLLSIISTGHAATLQTAYLAAVQNVSLHNDAANTNLTAISESNVIAVSYTEHNDYTVGKQQIKRDTWVTVAPELKKKCQEYTFQHKNLTSKDLDLWIRQLLGLPPPKNDRRKFVVMQLKAIQTFYGESPSEVGIFRPCTDPRIAPHQGSICPRQMNESDNKISSEYKTWFINNTIDSYTAREGYPWTGYGYTYNWNPDSKSHIGLSEFVIRQGSIIQVLPNLQNASTPYIDIMSYCR